MRQQSSQGCKLKQAWEDFVQKVSTLPTETWEKSKPLRENFVVHTELFCFILVACLCLWQSSNFHYQNVRLGDDSVLEIMVYWGKGQRQRSQNSLRKPKPRLDIVVIIQAVLFLLLKHCWVTKIKSDHQKVLSSFT